MGRFVAFFGFLLGLAATSSVARADVVAEQGFAVDVRGATVCWIEPASMRVDANCTQSDLALPIPGIPKNARRLALGHAHGLGSGEYVGLVQIMRLEVAGGYVDQTYADLTVKGARDGATRALPAGTPVTIDPPHVEHNGDTRFASFVIRIGEHMEGAKRVPGTASWALQVPAHANTWTVTMTATGANAATMETIVAQTKATIALEAKDRPAPGKSTAYSIGYRVGQAFGVLIVALVIGAIVVVQQRRERRARQAAEQAAAAQRYFMR